MLGTITLIGLISVVCMFIFTEPPNKLRRNAELEQPVVVATIPVTDKCVVYRIKNPISGTGSLLAVGPCKLIPAGAP